MLRKLALAALLVVAPPMAVTAASPEVPHLYEDALQRFDGHDLEGARIQLQNALQRDPEHLPSRILLGRTYLRQGDGAAAEKELTLAREGGADPNLVDVPLAEAYLKQHQYEELLSRVHAVGHPPHIDARILVLRGQAHLELNDVEAAERAFIEAQGLDPGLTTAHLGDAAVLLRRGDIEAAERVITALDAGDDPDVWYLLGEVRRVKGDTAGAIRAYGRTLAVNPDHGPARTARAALHIGLGDDGAAREDLDYMLETQPFDPQAHYLTALLLLREGKPAEARTELSLAAAAIGAMDPKVLERHAPSLLLSGMISFLSRDFESAFSKLDRYLLHNPRHVGVRTRLAAIHLQRGEPGKAIAVIEPALETDPRNPLLFQLLGTAYERLGDHGRAAAMYEEAITHSPERGSIHAALARARMAAGEVDGAIGSLTTAFELMPASTRTGLQLATLHIGRAEYAEAKEIALQLLADDPTHLAALNLRGAAELGLGARAQARASFEQAVAIAPEFLPARFNLAALDRLEGDTAGARERLLAILDAYPESTRAMGELADLARLAGDTSDAIRWLEKLKATDPEAVAPLLRLVDIHLEQQQPREALQVAKDLQLRHPEDLDVLAALGRSYQATGRLDVAQATFENMAQLASFDTRRLVRIAALQRGAGDHAGAHYTLIKAIRGDRPGFLPAREELVRTRIHLGRHEEAIATAREVVDESPDRAASHRLLADALAAAGHHAEARAAYARAQSITATTAGVLGLAEMLFRQGREGEAMARLEEWLAAHPGDNVVGRRYGQALIARGRWQEALEHHESLVRGMPDDPGVHNDLALLRHRLGRGDALAAARRAHELAPQRVDVLDTLGWLLVQSGQAVEGLTYLRRAHSRASEVAEIRYHLGVALARLGRTREARVELQAALDTDQSFDGGEDARTLLETLGD